MLLSCSTQDFASRHGDEGAIRLLGAAGFEALDFNINHYKVRETLDPFWRMSYGEMKAYAEKMKKVAKEAGTSFGQLHSPYPTFYEDSLKYEEVRKVGERSIELCALLESPYIVIHPNVPPKCTEENYFELAMEPNLEYFSSFAPLLRKTGVKVAVENMFNWNYEQDRGLETVASKAENMAYIVDSLNERAGEKLFVACLDTGHGMISGGGNVPQMIRTLGKRLELVHIHDNDGRHDKHFQPFKGVIDWDAVCVAFKEVGYSGNLSLELKPGANATKEYAEEAHASAKRLYDLFLSK